MKKKEKKKNEIETKEKISERESNESDEIESIEKKRKNEINNLNEEDEEELGNEIVDSIEEIEEETSIFKLFTIEEFFSSFDSNFDGKISIEYVKSKNFIENYKNYMRNGFGRKMNANNKINSLQSLYKKFLELFNQTKDDVLIQIKKINKTYEEYYEYITKILLSNRATENKKIHPFMGIILDNVLLHDYYHNGCDINEQNILFLFDMIWFGIEQEEETFEYLELIEENFIYKFLKNLQVQHNLLEKLYHFFKTYLIFLAQKIKSRKDLNKYLDENVIKEYETNINPLKEKIILFCDTNLELYKKEKNINILEKIPTNHKVYRLKNFVQQEDYYFEYNKTQKNSVYLNGIQNFFPFSYSGAKFDSNYINSSTFEKDLRDYLSYNFIDQDNCAVDIDIMRNIKKFLLFCVEQTKVDKHKKIVKNICNKKIQYMVLKEKLGIKGIQATEKMQYDYFVNYKDKNEAVKILTDINFFFLYVHAHRDVENYDYSYLIDDFELDIKTFLNKDKDNEKNNDDIIDFENLSEEEKLFEMEKVKYFDFEALISYLNSLMRIYKGNPLVIDKLKTLPETIRKLIKESGIVFVKINNNNNNYNIVEENNTSDVEKNKYVFNYDEITNETDLIGLCDKVFNTDLTIFKGINQYLEIEVFNRSTLVFEIEFFENAYLNFIRNNLNKIKNLTLFGENVYIFFNEALFKFTNDNTYGLKFANCSKYINYFVRTVDNILTEYVKEKIFDVKSVKDIEKYLHNSKMMWDLFLNNAKDLKTIKQIVLVFDIIRKFIDPNNEYMSLINGGGIMTHIIKYEYKFDTLYEYCDSIMQFFDCINNIFANKEGNEYKNENFTNKDYNELKKITTIVYNDVQKYLDIFENEKTRKNYLINGTKYSLEKIGEEKKIEEKIEEKNEEKEEDMENLVLKFLKQKNQTQSDIGNICALFIEFDNKNENIFSIDHINETFSNNFILKYLHHNYSDLKKIVKQIELYTNLGELVGYLGDNTKKTNDYYIDEFIQNKIDYLTFVSKNCEYSVNNYLFLRYFLCGCHLVDEGNPDINVISLIKYIHENKNIKMINNLYLCNFFERDCVDFIKANKNDENVNFEKIKKFLLRIKDSKINGAADFYIKDAMMTNIITEVIKLFDNVKINEKNINIDKNNETIENNLSEISEKNENTQIQSVVIEKNINNIEVNDYFKLYENVDLLELKEMYINSKKSNIKITKDLSLNLVWKLGGFKENYKYEKSIENCDLGYVIELPYDKRNEDVKTILFSNKRIVIMVNLKSNNNIEPLQLFLKKNQINIVDFSKSDFYLQKIVFLGANNIILSNNDGYLDKNEHIYDIYSNQKNEKIFKDYINYKKNNAMKNNKCIILDKIIIFKMVPRKNQFATVVITGKVGSFELYFGDTLMDLSEIDEKEGNYLTISQPKTVPEQLQLQPISITLVSLTKNKIEIYYNEDNYEQYIYDDAIQFNKIDLIKSDESKDIDGDFNVFSLSNEMVCLNEDLIITGVKAHNKYKHLSSMVLSDQNDNNNNIREKFFTNCLNLLSNNGYNLNTKTVAVVRNYSANNKNIIKYRQHDDNSIIFVYLNNNTTFLNKKNIYNTFGSGGNQQQEFDEKSLIVIGNDNIIYNRRLVEIVLHNPIIIIEFIPISYKNKLNEKLLKAFMSNIIEKIMNEK